MKWDYKPKPPHLSSAQPLFQPGSNPLAFPVLPSFLPLPLPCPISGAPFLPVLAFSHCSSEVRSQRILLSTIQEDKMRSREGRVLAMVVQPAKGRAGVSHPFSSSSLHSGAWCPLPRQPGLPGARSSSGVCGPH